MSQPLMGAGEFALVCDQLTAAVQKPPTGWNPVGDHEILVMLADIAALERDETVLSQYAQRAEEISTRLGHRLYQAVSWRALGILAWLQADTALAEARIRQSYASFMELGTAWQAGRCLLDLGEFYAAQYQPQAAKTCFSQALAAFETMRVQPTIDRTLAWLKKLS
jgi:hypothetical protein